MAESRMANERRAEKIGDWLRTVRQHVVAAIAEEERLHERYDEATTAAGRWAERAELARSKGLLDLAGQAADRMHQALATADGYLAAYHRQRREVIALKREWQAIEAGRSAAAGAAPVRHHRTSSLPREGARRAAVERAAIALEADPVADRLAKLEREDRLGRELAELKAKLTDKG